MADILKKHERSEPQHIDCPLCSSPLTLENVAALRDGKVIECPFCAVSIGR